MKIKKVSMPIRTGSLGLGRAFLVGFVVQEALLAL